MKRVAVFGSIAQFEAFVNDAKVSVIDVKVSTCEQSYNFQECFVGVVFYEDAPNLLCGATGYCYCKKDGMCSANAGACTMQRKSSAT